MRRRLARLNHILIPTSRAERDRLRQSRIGRFLLRFEWLFYRATAESQLLAGVCLFAGLTGVEVTGNDAHLLFSMTLSLLLGALALSQRRTLSRVRLVVSCPPQVTIGEELRVAITLQSASREPVDRAQVVGPFLPWDGEWSGPRPRPCAIEPGGAARVEARARFHQRGPHSLDPFRAGLVGPLGLFLGPTITGEPARFMVVPRIAAVRSLRTPAPRVPRPGGVARLGRAGDSMDLLGTRPYRPGDRARDLHARTWARTGVPVVREYVEETVSAVGVVLDPTALDDESFDARLSLVAGILAHLLSTTATVDLIVASARGGELAVGRRFASLAQALEWLACVEPADAQPPEVLAARVDQRAAPWSRALIVCGEISPRQRELARALEVGGVPCGLLSVVAQAAPTATHADEVRVLESSAVVSGRELWL
jgi:uncharacterized protein (DUF58 family)